MIRFIYCSEVTDPEQKYFIIVQLLPTQLLPMRLLPTRLLPEVASTHFSLPISGPLSLSREIDITHDTYISLSIIHIHIYTHIYVIQFLIYV